MSGKKSSGGREDHSGSSPATRILTERDIGENGEQLRNGRIATDETTALLLILKESSPTIATMTSSDSSIDNNSYHALQSQPRQQKQDQSQVLQELGSSISSFNLRMDSSCSYGVSSSSNVHMDSSFSYIVRNKEARQRRQEQHECLWKPKLTKIFRFCLAVAVVMLLLSLVCGGFEHVFRYSLVWSMVVMLTIVGLLLAWEEAVHMIRHSLPQALTPVVDSILAEMGGLGFIGLFLHTAVMGGILEPYIEQISEEFLGESDTLVETFEFLHEVFFQVGVGFFFVSGVAVGEVLLEIKRLGEISQTALDTDGDGEVTLEELADALHVEAIVVDANNDGEIDDEEITAALRQAQRSTLWEMFTMTQAQVGAEVLVMRERLLRQFNLPNTFEIEKYFELTFGKNLEEMVEMSPVTWLPLIPLLALTNGIDLDKSIISAASDNASEACGEFLTNPVVIGTISLVQIVSLVWSVFNYWKLARMKSLLVPTLVRDGSEEGPAVLLPPRYLDERLREEFHSSPWWVRPIEHFLGRNGNPARTPHEKLWGAAGVHGPEIYRSSIKFHTWLCVTGIVYLGSQIVMRDIRALCWAETLETSDQIVISELIVYGFFVLISMAQLALAPKTFLYYSYVTSIEELAKDWAMKAAMDEQEQHYNDSGHHGRRHEHH